MNKSNVFKVIAVSMSLTAALSSCSVDRPDVGPGLGSTTEALSSRRAFGKTKPQQPRAKHRLVVKFTDDLRARASASGDMRSDVTSPPTQSKASAVSQIAQRFGMRFSQLLQLPEQEIETLRTRAALASKQEQPDLAGILVAEVPEADLQAAADALHASPLTEFVYFQELTPPPPQACTDIAPPTTSYTSLQGYRGPNPGVNMTAAWELGPARGAGIKIADCEYGYKAAHEDLCGVIMEPGQTPDPFVAANGWDHHGTAVLGELIGRDNGYGCTGLTPDAQPYFFPEYTVEEGGRRATAIAHAITTVSAGDVVLLEMQTGINGGGYGPAELDPAVWLVVKSGVDAGVIVVAAAGNGTQDLDSSSYDEYRSRGDSGAIIVGAGSPSTAHQPLSFSTYGSRVNVQGWGGSVVSTGYGDLAQLGGDVNQSYTSSFSGTSSASPIVAASVAALQSYAVSSLARRLTPLEMRNLLIETGTPQGTGVHIGPLPNVVAAIQQLNTTTPTIPAAPTNLVATAGNAQASLTWTASAGATSYAVLRSTTSGSGYTTVASNLTATNYVNTGLTNGTPYFFVVTATNTAGTSVNSNQASATPTGVTIPAAPTNLAATAGNAQASLTWTASAGATSYTVRRSTTSGGGYTTVASNLTATNYVNTGLTNGTQYFFVVTATNTAGTSSNSNQASATPTGGGGGQACTGAITVTGGQSGNFNTTGPVCYRTSNNIVGWGCSNFAGRTLSVNGTAVTCGQTPLPPKLADGFRYFSISGGSFPWASFYWWM
jgi:subtilisin family serine protease